LRELSDLAGFALTFVLMAAYFFVCQFRLSRGKVDAPRKDWPIMLALNAAPLVMVILMVGNEKWPVIPGSCMVAPQPMTQPIVASFPTIPAMASSQRPF
jgi:hypothetical protein